MRVFLLLVPLLLSLTGCSGLIVRDTDSPAAVTGKVAVRAILALPTFLISEIAIASAKQDEQRAIEQSRYTDWFRSLSREEQEREWTRQNYERGMALQALGLGLMGGGPIRQHSNHMVMPNRQMPANCWSPIVGQGLMTQCY